MIEGGLAPFETPFFFILIDPSKGSWRQLAAAGPSFLGLEALPCGPGGFMRGWQPLHLPICGRSARAWPCHARRPGLLSRVEKVAA